MTTTSNIQRQRDRYHAGAVAALRATFRERAHLPGSPWFAFLATSGGVLVVRTDNPEEAVGSDWRVICSIRNDLPDDRNAVMILRALDGMPVWRQPEGSAS